MLKRFLYACIVALICSQPGSINAQGKEYLYKTYLSAGGPAAIREISSWRLQERDLLKARISELPEPVKQDLIADADAALQQPWAQLLLSDYREFQLNGNRVNFEKLYFSRRSKLSSLCAGELASGKGKYVPEIVNGLWLILEESTWVLPAHLTGNNGKTGPDPQKPVLDLFTAETAAQLAWASLLLNDELTVLSPTLVKRIEYEVNTRITIPYLATNEYWWMGFNGPRKQNNWNIWINSNLLKVAVLNMNDETRRIELIDKVIRSADKFLDTYPADGGCDEGPAYWSAAGGALGEFLSLLNRVSSGKLDWKSNPLIHNIGRYICKVHIDSTRFVNFADAPGTTLPDPGRVYNFGEMFDDPKLKSFASYLAGLNSSASGMLGAGSINVFASNVRVSKYLTSNPPKAPMPQQNWLPDLQVLNLRETEGSSKGLSFMAKGGHNDESHNHNDVGNFMLYLDGSPILIDLGKGTYTKQTFGPDRYKLWYIQSQWHNSPQINGADQQAGPNFKASAVSYKPGAKQEILEMDLAGAFPLKAGAKDWQRKFIYNRTSGSLNLMEQYVLTSDTSSVKVNFIACKKPVVQAEGKIRLLSFSGKNAVLMIFDPKLFNAIIEEKLIDDSSLKAVWGEKIYRVSLENKQMNSTGKHTIRFEKAN